MAMLACSRWLLGENQSPERQSKRLLYSRRAPTLPALYRHAGLNDLIRLRNFARHSSVTLAQGSLRHRGQPHGPAQSPSTHIPSGS